MLSGKQILGLLLILSLSVLIGCASSSQQQGQQEAVTNENTQGEITENLADNEEGNNGEEVDSEIADETNQFAGDDTNDYAAINSDSSNEFLPAENTGEVDQVAAEPSLNGWNGNATGVSNTAGTDLAAANAASSGNISQPANSTMLAEPASTMDATGVTLPAAGVSTQYDSVSQLPKCGL